MIGVAIGIGIVFVLGLMTILRQYHKPLPIGLKRGRYGQLSYTEFRPWVTDKQVIILVPDEAKKPSESKAVIPRGDMVRRGMMTPPGQDFDPHYDWPRKIRVTITNGSQTHLIGECDLKEEGQFNAYLSDAERQCQFLNQNEVK